MACDSITDIVVRESGRYLDRDIYNRTFGRSPWVSLIKRGIYPGGLGDTINVLTYERSAPTATSTWNTVTTVDGQEGGACLPPHTNVGVASTTRNFNLQRYVLHGPDFCAEDLRTPFALAQQLNRITDILAERTMLEWEQRDRAEYFRLVQTKVVINTCPQTESTTMASSYPAFCPTGQLTLGILEKYKVKLLRDGAANSALLREGGAPLLTVIVSAETAFNIIRQNENLRNDIRYASMGGNRNALLLQGLGVNFSLSGFMFLIDMFPRRFTCSGGVYTEVQPFTTAAATKGTKTIVNPTWETAPYEESFIFDPEVFHQLIPQPIVNPAPNFTFDPVTYTGNWRVVNIPDRICNPDGTILFHRGILAAGSMPVHPERGVAFVHLRCDPPCNLVTSCSS